MSRKSPFFLAIALLAFLLVVTGCTQSTVTPASNQPTAPTAAGSSVTIKDFAFGPQALTIKAGTTVTWTNNDSTPHTVTSSTFESSQLLPGQSFQHTFTDAGTYDYSCSIHPSMTGQVIVQQ